MRPDFEARMLALRVDGLTAEQLQDTLLKFANGGLLPDHNRFLWRATGLLKAHPELLVQMEALFHNAALESRGRQLVLDLLVGTGTPQAQAVLRSVLASRTAQADPNFVMFYQRLGLVAAPDEKTVATAAEHYRSPGPEGRPAAVYSYGAVLGNRLAQGDLLAKGMANAVLKDLHEARTPQEQVLLLMALGNAGVPEQSADIATFASSGDALVRRATANALRKDMDPQVTSVLAGMVSDVETDVQRRALMSLQGRELDAAGWRALTAAVQAGGLGEASFEVLLDVVSTSVHVPEARQVLEALVLLQPPPSIHVLGRAREMLSAYQPQDTQVSPEDLDEPAP
jgi:HEAT repeat protein